MMTKADRSDAAKKAARSRAKMKAARGSDAPGRPDRVGYAAIIAATTDDVSAGYLAQKFGRSPAYIRAVWRRCGLTPRLSGYRPRRCASPVRKETAHHGAG